jgi:bacillithiol biosynthesis deacetylase BshB1
MKLDILAVGAHPDDVELGCSGTLMKHISLGYKAGIVDLTQGELGTRGTIKDRRKEAASASKIMGVHARENMRFKDGFFQNDKEHQLEVIKMIRHFQPKIVFGNAQFDRHPDHARAAQLVYDACFLAGLPKVETKYKGKLQKAFRPVALYHYIQALHTEPDFCVDITKVFNKKMEAVLAYQSQFYNPTSKEPETFISTKGFLEFVKSRSIHFGIPIGVQYAEAFTVNRTVGVEDVTKLL